MKLPRSGIEYARWNITSDDELDLFEVEVDGVWHPTTYANGVVSLLFRGPDAPPSVGAVTLTRDVTHLRIRAADFPEVVVREAGTIELSRG